MNDAHKRRRLNNHVELRGHVGLHFGTAVTGSTLRTRKQFMAGNAAPFEGVHGRGSSGMIFEISGFD
jgi:hypothetical protein